MIAGTAVAAIGGATVATIAIVLSRGVRLGTVLAVNPLAAGRIAPQEKPSTTARITPTLNPPVAVNSLADERQPTGLPAKARFGAHGRPLQKT